MDIKGGKSMAKQNIELVRGDTLAFGFKYTGTNQELDTCYFTIKADYDVTHWSKRI